MLKKFCDILLIYLLSTAASAEGRFIIKYKPDTIQSSELKKGGTKAQAVRMQMMEPLSKSRLNQISNLTNLTIIELDAIATGAHVITVNKVLDEAATQNFIKNVEKDPDVEYIEEDKILKPLENQVASLNPEWQWDMATSGGPTAQVDWDGDNFYNAWQTLNNNGYGVGANVTVAVVDTGYTPHPNFMSALQQLGNMEGVYGYQMISDCRMSGECASSTPDSQANSYPYKADAKDQGDYVSVQDINSSNGFFTQDCYRGTSTWHGSHVTGIIGANGYSTDHSMYMAGGAYGAKIVPVRVLGKCGGYVSDITNGVLWASGLSIKRNSSILPVNPNPAQVINLSLGGDGGCSRTEQDTIDDVVRNGSIIVVAAGNDGDDISQHNPSSCKNVVVVAAKGPTNALADYSNYGNTTITASGGDGTISGCTSESGIVVCPSMIYSTVWSSPHGFVNTDAGGYPDFAFYSGTSMAAPHVTAAIANIISLVKAKNQGYTLYGITQVLQQTAQQYDNCSSSGCTATGALDTAAAINYVIQNNQLPVDSALDKQTTPSGASSGSGGGGGCSAVQDGDDYSLMILLLLGSIVYICRNQIRNRERKV